MQGLETELLYTKRGRKESIILITQHRSAIGRKEVEHDEIVMPYVRDTFAQPSSKRLDWRALRCDADVEGYRTAPSSEACGADEKLRFKIVAKYQPDYW